MLRDQALFTNEKPERISAFGPHAWLAVSVLGMLETGYLYISAIIRHIYALFSKVYPQFPCSLRLLPVTVKDYKNCATNWYVPFWVNATSHSCQKTLKEASAVRE